MTTPTSARSPAPRLPTGERYIDSLRDGRDVWIYGRRVRDVTTHPAFRNAVRMNARFYDALHDPEQHAGLLAADDGDGQSF